MKLFDKVTPFSGVLATHVLTLACRSEDVQQLANVPPADYRGRACWWTGYSEGDGGEWGVPGDS
jgi:hypothetical protein